MKRYLQNFARSYLKLEILRPTTHHIRTPRFPGLLLDTSKIDILEDPAFLNALDRSKTATILDTPRLANLWTLARMTNPAGAIVEVGSYQGGSALVLAEACPQRSLFVCDTFAGFGTLKIDAERDRVFYQNQFDATSLDSVKLLLGKHLERTRLLQGYFPESDRKGEVRDISFAHLDCDLLVSMQQSLAYLKDRLLPRSLIVVDDYRRNAAGVDEAVTEWTAQNREWCAFPLFPGQGLLIHKSWFE